MPAKMDQKEMEVKEMELERLTNGDFEPGERIVQSIPTVPVTVQRKLYVNDADSVLHHPGTARANIAPSAQSPNGTTAHDWAAKHAHQSVLQQHCDFFDQDRDGVIWPQDTFIGFHRLGFGILLSLFAMFIIHVNFSWYTLDRWLPDPWFRLYAKNAHRTKHGGDSGTFDNEGRFVPQAFENIFEKYGGGRDYLTKEDLMALIKGQRNVSDPIGTAGAIFEWTMTYLMLWPEDGKMKKEDVRGCFDGSIFYTIAERVAKQRAEKKKKAY